MKRNIVLLLTALMLTAALAFFLPACSSNAASKLEPDVAAETFLNSGNAFYNRADFDRAIMDYDQAILLNPQLAEAYNNRGYVYFIKGDMKAAIADFEAALKLDPDYTSAKNNLERAKQ